MKSIKELNEENEKTEVYFETIDIEPIKYIPFNMILGDRIDYCDKVVSGRGGQLLKANRQSTPGLYLKVKCSKTGLKGKLFWKHSLKNIIARIEWEDGVIKRY